MILTAQQTRVLARSFPAHAVDVQVTPGTRDGCVLAAFYDDAKRLRRDMTIGRTGHVYYDHHSPRWVRVASGELRIEP